MPKMRGIKPEIWTDEKFVELTPMARLLFIGTWNFACDNGHVDDSARQLRMRVLPADMVDAEPLIKELLEAGLLERGDGWLKVVNLTAHQRLDLRFLTLCDHCANDDNSTYSQGDRTERPSRARRAPSVGTVGARIEGEGEGEGEGGTRATPSRGTRIPNDFTITDDMRQWATEKDHTRHLDLDATTERFIDYWRGRSGKDATKTDWVATWRNWVRRDADDARTRPTRQANTWAGVKTIEQIKAERGF